MRLRQLLALAWRESRFARRRLVLFLSAISLGVAALVAVMGFAREMERGVARESKALLGADLVLESRRPFAERTLGLLDSLRAARVPVAHVTSFTSMTLLPRTGGTRLAQVRAVEPGYPFYGRIETEPAGRWAELHAGRNALADPSLLAILGARLGDSISLGETRFALVGVLAKVPGDLQLASSFAPRLYIPAAFLDETGLLEFGSRVDFAAYLRLAAPEPFLESHEDVLRADRVRGESAAERQRDLNVALGRLASYLGLVGVFALLLGGIGVASTMGAHLSEKGDAVAVLRCLGATGGQVLGIYLAQAAAMGMLGAAIGAGIGGALQWTLPQLARNLIPVEATGAVDTGSIAVGMGVGLWTAVLFAALPLLRVRNVSPLGALRRRVEPLPAARSDPVRWGVFVALAASVLLLLSWQVGSVRLGASLAAGCGAALLALWIVARGLMAALRRLPAAGLAYLPRQGLANLHRPGNQTVTVSAALGFGVFLLATLVLVQASLLRPLSHDDREQRANLLFWDVQDDQVPGLVALLAGRKLAVEEAAPIVPMRIADSLAAAERWALRREYRSTWRDEPGEEQIVDGEWWRGDGAADEEGVYPVSLEVEIARDLGVGVGDRITWDVQGVLVPTRVTSLREVEWARFEPNFFAVFPSAALRDAPQSWIVLARAGGSGQRAAIQRDAVLRFPNVAAVDLTQVQEALAEVLGQVAAVIRFLAAFSLATGFVVLLGAVAASRLPRIREGVLLKALGATRRQIGAILLTEYLAVGTIATLTGILLALGASWALCRRMLETPLTLAPGPLGLLAVGVVTLSGLTGVIAGRDVFARTAMEAIRED